MEEVDLICNNNGSHLISISFEIQGVSSVLFESSSQGTNEE
jgi:hypothetical protein